MNAWSLILKFSLTTTFHLTKKPEKSANTASILFISVKVLNLPKNLTFYKTFDGFSKIKVVLTLIGLFSRTTYAFVLIHQISSF